jgi:hypothetical protein
MRVCMISCCVPKGTNFKATCCGLVSIELDPHLAAQLHLLAPCWSGNFSYIPVRRAVYIHGALQTWFPKTGRWFVKASWLMSRVSLLLVSLPKVLTVWQSVWIPTNSYRLIKKLAAFYGSRGFIIVFPTDGHLSLFWARLMQSMHAIRFLKTFVILSCYLSLGLSNAEPPFHS